MPETQYSRHMPSRYVSTNLLPAVSTDLRRLVATLTVEMDRRVTVSEVVAGLLDLAQEQRPQLIELITATGQGSDE